MRLLILLAVALTAWGSDCITPGEICSLKSNVIKLGKIDWVPSATSKVAYDEMRKAMSASDTDGLKQMILRGQVLLTEGGSGVRILDVSVWSGYAECRMVTGEYKGTKVFTARAWIVP
jgi:hypothetical protein